MPGTTPAPLPAPVARTVAHYLWWIDRLLPERVLGLYVVGSVALGAYRPERSDVDFIAVVDGDLDRRAMRRLRVVHVAAGGRSLVRNLPRGRIAFPGTCNGVLVRAADLALPVSRIQPLAAHIGHEFRVAASGEINPVVWKVLLERGIAVRGAPPDSLGLDPEPHTLRDWNRGNLANYWRPWAEARTKGPRWIDRPRPRWTTAWGVLGAPRLLHTIATGDVISKEAAGEYALAALDRRWQPLVREALAYWRGEPADPAWRDPRPRIRETASFVLEVVRAGAETVR